MHRTRLQHFAVICLISDFCATAARRAVAAIVAAVFRHLGDATPWRFRLPSLASVLTLPRRTYVGPPVGLRYEAGRASLAAARGI
jgi:hypothetical protein